MFFFYYFWLYNDLDKKNSDGVARIQKIYQEEGMSKKILIVDDEEFVCQLVKKVLERQGDLEVLVAIRGKQGIAIAKEKRPDLILLDIVMPGMSGAEVAEALLEDPLTKSIPVLFLSALVQKEEVASGEGRIGGRSFISKPVTPDELITRIREALSEGS